MIEERISPQHPVVGEPTIAQPQVDLGPFIGAVYAPLGKYQLILLLMQRNQQVKLRIIERKMLVRIQLHPGSTELVQPLLDFPPDRTGSHSACQRRGGLTVRVACPKTTDSRGQPGGAQGLSIPRR
ncbi:hypothetical protein D3C72_1626000 [compost metagenome]